MGVNGDPDESVYQELCVKLNMDKDTADEAWQNYQKIRVNYLLEGNQLHWLACALYVSCRKSTTPTVGKPEEVVEGNCVSLTRLLRLSKLSLIDFFNKCKKWADMASLPAEFREKIESLERNFAVSREIFKKFQPIFRDLFQEPGPEPPQQSRTSRKQKNQPCTPARVFELTWSLFVCVKVDYPDVRDDLVNSYHMLLACCDLIFGNALLADRRDLLNPVFPGLPKDFSSPDYQPPKTAPCVIDKLCESHDGIPLEAKGIKAYWWKIHIKKLFEQRVLKGNAENFSGILDVNNFDHNLKAINKQYEEHVLNVGDFDERIFLAEIKRLRACLKRSQGFTTPTRPVLRALNVEGDAEQDIGVSTNHGMGGLSEKLRLRNYVPGSNQLIVSTPLTNRRYLRGAHDSNEVTPLTTATQSVNRLHSLLSGRTAAPSETLLEIFKSCSRDPKEKVLGFVSAIGQKFCERYSQQASDQERSGSMSSMDFAKKRLQLGETLYYKILENIITDEKKQKPHLDFSNLLEQEVFHQTLLACSIEIVIFAYNAPSRTFPWILDALNVEPYYFYKVIEPIVRAEEQLSRDMIKHLNEIEEKILESMAWRSESSLWDNIKSSGLPVPSCEDVSLPSQLTVDGDAGQQQAANPVLKRLSGAGDKGSASPTSSVSAVDRFNSPVSQGIPKKRLFDGELAIKPGQSLLQSKVGIGGIQITTVKGENGQQYIPIQYVPGANSVIISAQPSSSGSTVLKSKGGDSEKKDEDKPKRTGSLCLFFRKFYHLGSVRMQELCNHLQLTDSELKRKIWTCFQHAITNHVDLMRDRHIDQLLMCSVYVICKVTKNDQTFTNVMKCYRMQPQASSHVYRSVLLKKVTEETGEDNTAISAPLPKALGSPTDAAGTSNNFRGEVRGDLIKFYNEVFVSKMKAFAQKFCSDSQNDSLPLSPLPVCNSQPSVPRRRVTDKLPVFISSLNPQDVTVSPSKLLDYKFSRSPARDLRAINNMIQVDGSRKVAKRLLADDSTDEASLPKIPANDLVSRKLHSIIGDRIGQSQV
ncbi:Retinoblastoma-like protein 1 [Frankliniella fusca]|uniref:Retinoblastoma-like protein 1 n=1 Tax=Frankliniella fusca TaxID=407009 RepID=A0AAE1HTP3_9NEOP|nr:Retinoblastoma-like protein 1 [Frankliniella fusca]